MSRAVRLRPFLLGLGFPLLVALALLARGPLDRAFAAESPDPVARGRHLVDVLGCDDCHTPLVPGPDGPVPDLARRLSGHPRDLVMPPPPKLDAPWGWAGSLTNTAFAGPWGVTYAPNLTPDELSGLGIWTEEMFVRALKTGRHWGQSRPIQPPMPWTAYRHLPEEDLKAVYAYLRTVPAVRNTAPDYRPPGASEDD